MPRAPKHCSSPDCWNKALPGQRNCADCGNSRWAVGEPNRMHEIPQETYMRIFKRDKHTCQIQYVGTCTGDADALDHIVPHFEGGDDGDENLQAACEGCHGAKSSDEGHRAQGHKVKVRQRISYLPGDDTGSV